MKAVISLSGGMDSATVLALAASEGRKISCVGFNYGSKHNRYENLAASSLADHYKVPFRLIDLSGIMKGFVSNLMKGEKEIPEGHYEDSSMSLTVVPARNIIFASILAGIAWSENAKEVWLGIHSGDRAVYPDCRPEFFAAMNEAISLGTDGKIRLKAPFLSINKVGILETGLKLKVPYEKTRTCYKDQSISCGRCGACQERREAFSLNGIEDPIPYEN
mgnify:CR=1 FL=1